MKHYEIFTFFSFKLELCTHMNVQRRMVVKCGMKYKFHKAFSMRQQKLDQCPISSKFVLDEKRRKNRDSHIASSPISQSCFFEEVHTSNF